MDLEAVLAFLYENLWLFGYLVGINLAAFFAYGVDKVLAMKQKRRISERALLTLALLGGALGALSGMYTFRHKTRKAVFTVGVPAVLLVWAAAIYILAVTV